MQPDYYEILQVAPDAEPEIISAAYRKLAQKYHPDRTLDNGDRMRLLNEAYEVLSNPDKRRKYDCHRPQQKRRLADGAAQQQRPKDKPRPLPEGVILSLHPQGSGRASFRLQCPNCREHASETVRIGMPIQCPSCHAEYVISVGQYRQHKEKVESEERAARSRRRWGLAGAVFTAILWFIMPWQFVDVRSGLTCGAALGVLHGSILTAAVLQKGGVLPALLAVRGGAWSMSLSLLLLVGMILASVYSVICFFGTSLCGASGCGCSTITLGAIVGYFLMPLSALAASKINWDQVSSTSPTRKR